MDIYGAAVAGLALLVVMVVGLNAVSVWRSSAEAKLELAREKAVRMARLDEANPKKNRKKQKKKPEDDQDDQDDPLLRIIDHPAVRGFAQRLGVDVDLVVEGDEAELQKVERLLQRVPGGGGAGVGLLG